MKNCNTFSTAVHGNFTTVVAGLSCELCASGDNFGCRWLALDPKGLPNIGSCVKLRPLLPPGALGVSGNVLSFPLSCTTFGIHLVLWPGDQRGWINRKGMIVCQVKSWTVSVQAQASARGRVGQQRGACGQGPCSHLSWQPLRAASPSLRHQSSPLSLRAVSSSKLFLLCLPFSSLAPTRGKKAQKQSSPFGDSAGGWLARLPKRLAGLNFASRLLF